MKEGEKGGRREEGERRGRRGRAQQRNHCVKQKILRVENERMKCGMCAQTRPCDKVTLFFPMRRSKSDELDDENIQQSKSDMDVEQRGRVGDRGVERG